MNGKATGDFIAEVRKQKNMTQRDLAEKIGVSDKTISKWETGKSIPDLSCIDALCGALEVSVNEILSGQHLSESDYTQKAEETIMSLMKDNEKTKSRNYTAIVIGVVLIVLSIFMLLVSTENGYVGFKVNLIMYIDLMTLLLLVLPVTGMVLISKKRTYLEILKHVDKVVVPIGAAVSLASVVILLSNLDDLSTIGPHLAVCILSMLYAYIAKIVVIALISRKE